MEAGDDRDFARIFPDCRIRQTVDVGKSQDIVTAVQYFRQSFDEGAAVDAILEKVLLFTLRQLGALLHFLNHNVITIGRLVSGESPDVNSINIVDARRVMI